MKFIGEDLFFWVTDFPCGDHGGEYVKELRGLLAETPASPAAKLAAGNVAAVYGF